MSLRATPSESRRKDALQVNLEESAPVVGPSTARRGPKSSRGVLVSKVVLRHWFFGAEQRPLDFGHQAYGDVSGAISASSTNTGRSAPRLPATRTSQAVLGNSGRARPHPPILSPVPTHPPRHSRDAGRPPCLAHPPQGPATPRGATPTVLCVGLTLENFLAASPVFGFESGRFFDASVRPARTVAA